MGGPAKSQLVHEVDALGGMIGKMADRCYLQKRVLNRSKVSLRIRLMEAPLLCVGAFPYTSPSVTAWGNGCAYSCLLSMIHSIYLCAALGCPACKVMMHHSTGSVAPLL